MDFPDDNEWNAKTLDYGADLQVLIQYGVWNDANDRDDNGDKFKGDRNMDNIQTIMIKEHASTLALGAITAAASALFMY